LAHIPRLRSFGWCAIYRHLCGECIVFDGVILLVFFSAGRLSEVSLAELRELKKIVYRDKVLLTIAKWFSRLDVENSLAGQPVSQVVSALCQIRGVGPYTAKVVAASALRDHSTFGIDVWNRKILGRLLLNDEAATADAVNIECRKCSGDFAGRAVEYLIESEISNEISLSHLCH